MSTGYYRMWGGKRAHIGNFAGGWAFAARIYPGWIESWSDWKTHLRGGRVEIHNDSGERIEVEEFIRDVEENRWPRGIEKPYRGSWLDTERNLLRMNPNDEPGNGGIVINDGPVDMMEREFG